MKKQSNLSRLMGYAGGHKILTYLSWILSVMSALLALVPFWYIWRIVHDILEVSPDFSQAENVTGYGWSAVLFAVLSIVIYIAGLMCSHISAFRVAANIRKTLMRHITALPLGVTEKYGSGKLRRIVNSSSAATETYLAHRLPDKAGAIATPIGLLVLLLAFDWRLGLLSLVPVVLGFLIMMKMTGKDMAQRMEQYQNSLSDMSNEAVEYVRGVPRSKDFRADNLFFQTLQRRNRQLRKMGDYIHKGTASAHDVLYDCNQWCVRVFDCRGDSFYKERRNE